MALLVVNCNHWIAYHLIEALLDEEYTIDGILDETGDDDLTMFFGRNSRFSLVAEHSSKQYDLCLIIGENKYAGNIQANKKIIIDSDHTIEANTAKEMHIIQPPLLFGEWMPHENNAFYQRDEWIDFHSERFEQEAVYIKDFVTSLLQVMKSEALPPVVKMFSQHMKQTNDNGIYIRQNKDHFKKLEQILKYKL